MPGGPLKPVFGLSGETTNLSFTGMCGWPTLSPGFGEGWDKKKGKSKAQEGTGGICPSNELMYLS
jgi:hypothetical protein